MRFNFAIPTLGLILLSWNIPAIAKPKAPRCVPIPLVGGEGNQVSKTVSVPTIPAGPLGRLGIDITNNNWNTDWALSGQGQPFKTILIQVTSPATDPFEMRAFLKYSDQTNDEIFNQKAFTFTPAQPLEIKASPRPQQQPYQVNLFVAGVKALGEPYTASVQGCY
ncbi:hypothetical protein IQ218_16630 [Synechocystis salina LEGE 06099]|uniref:hypothetical protein n=1 Tax=Synechocystis salina TaxID=945780 RepID=UPI001880F63C|nr:hypothetical protein [Synechocystis salina]MBE9204760.1 hypothetical protein [Synechocystis salina LEGE 06099]